MHPKKFDAVDKSRLVKTPLAHRKQVFFDSGTPALQRQKPEPAPDVHDPKKRVFLRLAGMAGLGVIAAAFLPGRAQALVLGSSPTSGVVGVKDDSNVRINPATEESLQDLLTGQGVSKLTTSLVASGNVLVPGAGMRIRVYSTRFSLTADLTSVGFRFTAGGTDYERYVSPKLGGLYGSNNHPNYVEGGVAQALYCSITGSATVQINIDYLEV